MAKGLYQYLNELYKKPKKNLGEIYRQRLIKLRKQGAITKIKKPTKLSRARALGYKAKQGYVVVRVKIKRGGKKKARALKHGRRSARAAQKKTVGKSYQWIAEERVARKFLNLEVLNSYLIAEDGLYFWFEIILIDPNSPVIKRDPKINWICEKEQKGRVFRGLTSAANKSRGLRKKGKGAEKIRPSLRAHKRRAK